MFQGHSGLGTKRFRGVVFQGPSVPGAEYSGGIVFWNTMPPEHYAPGTLCPGNTGGMVLQGHSVPRA